MRVDSTPTYSEFSISSPKQAAYLKGHGIRADAPVLVSRFFFYFGDQAQPLPQRLQHIVHTTQGCKRISDEDAESLQCYLKERFEPGKLGSPNNAKSETVCQPANKYMPLTCRWLPNMNIITPAKINDAEAILSLQKHAYESEAKLYNDWAIPPLTQSLDSLKAEILAGGVLKYSQGETIIGSVRASLRDGRCEIGRLIVAPEFQGQGIGSVLLAAIEAQFPNAHSFELFTGSKSKGNIRLYQQHGYEIVTTKALSPAVTLVFMAKPQKVLA
jgi:ribosomal protein S18 acetylase RimI-like enzyme